MGDILHILDVCNSEKLIKAVGEIVGTKGIILNNKSLKVKITDYISLDIAKENKAIPFEVSNGKIKVCFADNVNETAMNTIKLILLNKGLVLKKLYHI